MSEAENDDLPEEEILDSSDSNQQEVDNNSTEDFTSTVEDDVEELVMAGEAAHRNGDHEVALNTFNKAIALDPSNAMAWFNRGVLLEAEQDSKGARQSFVICLDLDPDHGPALANLAVLLDRIGENDGAVEIAQRALNHFPGHPSLIQILSENTAAGGVASSTPKVMPHSQDRMVNQVLHHANENKTNGNIPSQDVVIVEDEPAPIAEIVEEEIVIPEVEKIDLDALCVQATSLLTSGDAKGALGILKEHLHGEASTHFDSWKISAGAMASLSLDDHAIGAFTHALELDDSNSKCWFNLGAIHERKGNTEAAMKSFSAALERDNSYVKAAERLANVAEINGSIEELLNAKRKLVGQPNGRSELAKLLVELAEGEARILQNTAGLPPTIPEGPMLASEAITMLEPDTVMMARALSASGDNTAAVVCWKTIIQGDKENPDNWDGLAKALEAAGDMATAQRCREKASGLRNPAPINNQLDAFEAPSEPVAQPEPVVESTYIPEPVPQVEYTPEPEYVQEVVQQPIPEMTPRPEPTIVVQEARPEVNLAAAALEASSRNVDNSYQDANSSSIANQDIEWYNKGVGLIEDKKYREALSCFDRALPSFAGDDEMVIRILNGRGNALYYLSDYPQCVESYHQAMVINPSGVQGKTLYNMGTAYAEMQRFADAIKCFEQSMPRGLDDEQVNLAKEQIRRCSILLKEQQRN